jgi:hypothetical protein
MKHLMAILNILLINTIWLIVFVGVSWSWCTYTHPGRSWNPMEFTGIQSQVFGATCGIGLIVFFLDTWDKIKKHFTNAI